MSEEELRLSVSDELFNIPLFPNVNNIKRLGWGKIHMVFVLKKQKKDFNF